MITMVVNSIQLFFMGKLFRDPVKVFQDLAIGAVVTALVLVASSYAGANLWVSVGAAGLIGGALQPWLFRNLKYA